MARSAWVEASVASLALSITQLRRVGTMIGICGVL